MIMKHMLSSCASFADALPVQHPTCMNPIQRTQGSKLQCLSSDCSNAVKRRPKHLCGYEIKSRVQYAPTGHKAGHRHPLLLTQVLIHSCLVLQVSQAAFVGCKVSHLCPSKCKFAACIMCSSSVGPALHSILQYWPMHHSEKCTHGRPATPGTCKPSIAIQPGHHIRRVRKCGEDIAYWVAECSPFPLKAMSCCATVRTCIILSKGSTHLA